jgi:hypothetical protein
MAGTREGGKKAYEKIVLLRGPEAAHRLAVERGRKGGQAKVPKGFAISGKASEAGRIGGARSRRGSYEEA